MINAFNLVRMGIADAHGPAIYRSPKYGLRDSWTIKPAHQVTALAKRFLALMKSTPYGPYEATRLIFGTKAADALSVDSPRGSAQYICPPPIQPSPRKRSNPDTLDSDDASTSTDIRPAATSHKQSRLR